MENFNVFGIKSFFFLNILLKVIRQGIGNSVCLALAVIDLEVVLKKFLSLVDLSGAQTLCFYELSGVVIVGKQEDFMLKAF